MKRLFRIFDLSKNEQRVVLIVMLVLLARSHSSDTNAAFIAPHVRTVPNVIDRTETVSESCRS